MQAQTRIGRFRAVAVIGPDTWQVEADGTPGIARALEGAPSSGFDRLAERLVVLSHPALRPALAIERIEGRVWVVHPATSAATLADRLGAGHRPPYKIAIDVGVAILRGLAAAHGAGFTHGAVDARAVSWSDGRVQLAGVGEAALVGRTTTPAEDLRAVVLLLRTLVPEPPGELRALLASPPPTAEAFCRALKTLDPALGHDRDFDFSPSEPPPSPETAGPSVVTSAPPSDPPTAGGVDDVPLMAPVAPAASDPEDSWGVSAPASAPAAPRPGKGWVIEARDMVEASTEGEEDTWGVDPRTAPEGPARAAAGLGSDPGKARVHAISTAATTPKKAKGSPWPLLAIAAAVITVGLVGARIVMNQLEDDAEVVQPTVPSSLELPATPAAAPTPAVAEPAADAGLAADGSSADAATDAGRVDAEVPLVTLRIEPVPADVVRVKDGVLICQQSSNCPVAIDIDYRVQTKGYIAQDISGDALYDRRISGRLRLVLQPVPKPEKKKKRRR